MLLKSDGNAQRTIPPSVGEGTLRVRIVRRGQKRDPVRASTHGLSDFSARCPKGMTAPLQDPRHEPEAVPRGLTQHATTGTPLQPDAIQARPGPFIPR
jgi:hypothetical protein